MQSIERSKILSAKSHEDQLKYCVLLEAGERLRNLSMRTDEDVSALNQVLPNKYKIKVQSDTEHAHATPMIAEGIREDMETALVKFNTDTIITIIGESVTSKRARSISSLSREYLHFYCVFFGMIDFMSKMNSKEGMICMLTDFFYSNLEQKYIKIKKSCEKNRELSTDSIEGDDTPKKSPSQTQNRELEREVDAEVSSALVEHHTPEIPGEATLATTASPSNSALEEYAGFFQEALAMSPVLPMSSLADYIFEQTGKAPSEDSLESVAQKLHAMMQVVYTPGQKMLFLV